MKQFVIANILVQELDEETAEIICAILANEGYEGFEIKEDAVSAYIEEELYQEEDITKALLALPMNLQFSIVKESLENENWNETWEKNFYQPIIIGEEVLVKSSFHKTDLKANYTIVIDPKMSFGTGHHETTSTVLSALVSMDLDKKSIIDIGTGTGILAFYCSMRGAGPIVATDFDPICIENGKENEELNGLNGIEWHLGDRKVLEKLNEKYDVVIANINRNVLLQDMDQLSKLLNSQGTLYLSGFYTEDVSLIESAAKEHGLSILKQHSKNNWVCLELGK